MWPLSSDVRQAKESVLLDSTDGIIALGVGVAFMLGIARAFVALELSTSTRCMLGVLMLGCGVFWAYRLVVADAFPSSAVWSGLAVGLIGLGINQAALPWRLRRGMPA